MKDTSVLQAKKKNSVYTRNYCLTVSYTLFQGVKALDSTVKKLKRTWNMIPEIFKNILTKWKIESGEGIKIFN